MELFRKKARLVVPFKKVRTREEVDFQWTRTVVSAGVPMSFFDNEEVLKVVLMTTECTENYVRTKPGGVKETTLSHRTIFTTKLIPKLDKFIDNKNMGKIREMTQDLTSEVFNDGWTDVNHHPIVNIIMGVRSLHTLRASIDTMGEEKTMDFITDLILEHIKEIGVGRVFVVCMDGTCKGAFVLIQKGLDPLKEEKQARSGTCRAPRARSHQSEVGTVSTTLRDRSAPVGHRDDG